MKKIRKRTVLGSLWLLKTVVVVSWLILSPAHAKTKSENNFAQPENVESITVLAATSITFPISELALEYSRKEKIDVNVVFESASELMSQIEDGEPADIIVFSSMDEIRMLQNKGLLDPTTISKIAGNKLVLVGFRGLYNESPSTLAEEIDAVFSRNLAVIGDPETSALGNFTKQALVSLQKWEAYEKFLIIAPNSVKAVDLVIKSQVAGVIYATDYEINKKNLVHLGTFPIGSHKPIEYTGAVLVGDNMQEARKFLKFLASKHAKELFKNYSFQVQ